ncbi:NAD-dependent epimerase/dehydratase family protein [Flavobacterium sp. UMI-01]|uniref:NAD-dependent epimerase/dehydratase family protein n=1 Tax=Flavobacterium sp. UMI-01 TaxID=1441053 RepID=UPI001C7DA024|nr:NAD-dependent epimerase/dehydratase family protein [Flavobacterium sp. UMI-01]GIZ09941.1 NAD-dependent epimerase [Flavobacterium sp. UMI-01]
MILVTGGTGLVGAHLLLHLLENEEKVRAIYRNTQSIDKTKSLFAHYDKETLFLKIDWQYGDITDIPSLEKAFIGIDYVYHCAGFISFNRNDEQLLRKINIEGTANVVNLCIANHIKKLCHVSSVAALGDLAEHETIITETTEWNPEKHHSDYAISKYGGEMEIWRGQQEGLQTVIINPGVILGPGFNKQGSGLLLHQVAKGLSFYTKGITGFIAVDDVAKIAIQLLKSNHNNQRYILIASNTSYQAVINSMCEGLKIKKPSIEIKPWQLEIAWRIDALLSFLSLKKRTLPKDIARAAYHQSLFSNEKIKADLPIRFLDIHYYIMKLTQGYKY